ncbi:MAG: type I secretion system permease/ATPase [Magnetococcales bacterium]|nr:type I secretion system permease/ATPase [Magnetococcales bacterium]
MSASPASGPSKNQSDSPAASSVKEVVGLAVRAFSGVFLFSFCINLLLLAVPLYMLQLFDRVVVTRSGETLLYLTVIVTVALLVMAGLEIARSRILVRIGCWVEQQLAGMTLASSVEQTARGADPSIQGLRDLQNLRNFLSGPTVFPLLDAPWAPMFLVLIYLMHPLLGHIALSAAFVLFGFAWLNERLTRQPLTEAGNRSVLAMTEAELAVRNADVIRAMGMLPAVVKRWNDLGLGVIDQQSRISERSALISAGAKFVRLGFQVMMLGCGAYLAMTGRITPGVMIAASIIMGRGLAPIDQSIAGWKSFVGARQSYQRLEKLTENCPTQRKVTPLPRPRGIVQVENLTYAPPRSAKPILKQISFVLQPGQALGLIGPTASGKTTLARLLVGSLMPSVGQVRLDGRDVADWDGVDRGVYVGYLPQDVELFRGTVAENIARLGEASSESIIEAARLAGIHDLILKLPAAYDTVVGPQNPILSGGQKQRLGLARAVFGRPAMVVLDEPNANLDRAGEAALLETVAKLRAQGTTTILVSQRPAVLTVVDQILVLHEGGVRAQGSREAVLAELNLATENGHG